jgi:hypothetical protein
MTIDERLEALAERHEAMAQGVELLLASQRETDEKIRHLAIVAEQNEDRAAQMMEAIRRLARIADHHEDRIERLEKQ